ncbi:MAG TPA: hypothetical protein PKV44_05795 [Bacillota bacterium]|nr:hypothetical protein [Bacillota bacterium]HPE38660.1 hypothetical protein [Bacillota bacterium]
MKKLLVLGVALCLMLTSLATGCKSKEKKNGFIYDTKRNDI